MIHFHYFLWYCQARLLFFQLFPLKHSNEIASIVYSLYSFMNLQMECQIYSLSPPPPLQRPFRCPFHSGDPPTYHRCPRLHGYSILAHVPLPVSHPILVSVSYLISNIHCFFLIGISNIHCNPHMFLKNDVSPYPYPYRVRYRIRTRATQSVPPTLADNLPTVFIFIFLYSYLVQKCE